MNDTIRGNPIGAPNFRTKTEATVTLKVKEETSDCAQVDYNGSIYVGNATFTASVGDTITILLPGGRGSHWIEVNGEIISNASYRDPLVYKHTVVSNNVLITHGAGNPFKYLLIEDAPIYSNCTDTKGNILKPIFVNNIYWELDNGNLKMPKGYENSLLLFGNELTNNRIEATFVIKDTGLWDDANRRNGLVFALKDHNADLDFRYDGTDVSYYWAFINDWGCVEVIKMGAYGNWQWLSNWSKSADLYYDYGIDITQGVTLAAEWDNNGHIKVYANGILVQDVTDTTGTPLTGNYYGLLVNNHGNFNPAYGPYDSPVTSFIAG